MQSGKHESPGVYVEGGGYSYISDMGMCRCEGYGFQVV